MGDIPILIVNENDEPVGHAEKAHAQKQGLIHRIVQVMVEDPKGRLLLQKRTADRELHPGRWDTSVGGHVDKGEDYLTAAKRETLEEIGIRGLELRELGSYRKNSMFEWRHLNRFYRVYSMVVPADTTFKPDPVEISEIRWFSVEELQHLIHQDKGRFTAGVVEAITRFYS